ncbi:MAG: haloacid dehalogenase-like hydrolase [Candidatus Woesearchaeota archaeon]|nr:haloacid dehalogenase-like hydrolase [Candidatus Woesearchaeota archaeon]
MKQLLVTDMDGVLFHDKSVWIQLHHIWGTWEQGKKLTAEFLRSDYATLVKKVVCELWVGKPAKPYFDLITSAKLVDGAEEFFKTAKERGYVTAILSSGPYDLALRAQKELGIDEVYANQISIQNNKIAGTDDISSWCKNESKVPRLIECCDKHGVRLCDVTAVLHDDNDVALAKFIRENNGEVIGFMYDAHPELEKNCSHIVREKDLRAVLPFI